jgi:chromosome segregation ATPase
MESMGGRLFVWLGWLGFAFIGWAYWRLFRSSGVQELLELKAAMKTAEEQIVRLSEHNDKLLTEVDRLTVEKANVDSKLIDATNDKRELMKALNRSREANEMLVNAMGLCAEKQATQQRILDKQDRQMEELWSELTKLKAQHGEL